MLLLIFKKKIRIKFCTEVITDLFTDDKLRKRPFIINYNNYNKVELMIDFKESGSSRVSGKIIGELFFVGCFYVSIRSIII